MTRLLCLLLVALAGCSSGASTLDRCIQHSVEEGIARAQAEAGCEKALSEK